MVAIGVSSAEGLGKTVDGTDDASKKRDQSTVDEQKEEKSEPTMVMEPKTPSVVSNDDNGMHVSGGNTGAYLRENSGFDAPVGGSPFEQFGGSCDDVMIPCEDSLLACGLTAEELADLEMDVFSNVKTVV
eukprot:jgi/Picsp_1/2060/NSC_05525-R1_---NA---